MLVAADKRKNNIAEYVLYMWQIEDLIRAHQFNLEEIAHTVVYPATDEEGLRIEWVAWYQDLIDRMKREKIEQKGHLQDVKDVIVELFYLHNTLINIHKDERYIETFEKALPNIKEFQRLSNHSVFNDIETCFNAMYAKLLLRLQKREISKDTESAMNTFRDVLAYLAVVYKKMQTGDTRYNFN